jgi:hypothetical protein
MDAQLVGSAGARLQFEPGPSICGAANAVICDRPLPGRIDDHAPAAASAELSEPGLDPPLGLGGLSLDDSPIDFLDAPIGEQRPYAPQGLRVTSQYQASAGIAVEPVGESRWVRQAEAQLLEPAFEVGPAARAGMHGNAGRLVDDEDQTVAIKNAVGEPPPSRCPGPFLPRARGRARVGARLWSRQRQNLLLDYSAASRAAGAVRN